MTYICTYVRTCSRFLACRFPASSICREDSAQLLTLKVDGWACDAFQTCRARVATYGTQYLNTLQLHALQTTKTWAAPGNRAMVQASGTVRDCSTRASTRVVNISVHTISTLTSTWWGHTYTCSVRDMMQICILVKSCWNPHKGFSWQYNKMYVYACAILTGAMRKSMTNFWHSTPRDLSHRPPRPPQSEDDG